MTSARDAERLARLARFLPEFAEEGFEFGSWSALQRDEDGAILMPEYVQHPTASAFVQACYDDEWIATDFDWAAWATTREAASLRDDLGALEVATITQISKLLTVIVRQDRFVEGALASAFDSGLITRVLSRAATLAKHFSSSR
ncbi:DUF6508 domain-containing protein [Devosia sp.]|uniref:DUF6508 domain-containing protein n=1 Tax=Devosia sp. TaxID=1871048 RepID=UPI003F6F43B3